MTDTTDDDIQRFSASLGIKEERYAWRHDITVEIDNSPISSGCNIRLKIKEGWGTPSIYCELNPTEARHLSDLLRQAVEELNL